MRSLNKECEEDFREEKLSIEEKYYAVNYLMKWYINILF